MYLIKLALFLLLAVFAHTASITTISNFQAGISPDEVIAYRLFIKNRNEQYVRKINSQDNGLTLKAYPEISYLTLSEFSSIYSNKGMQTMPSNKVELVFQKTVRMSLSQEINNLPAGRVNNSQWLGPAKNQYRSDQPPCMISSIYSGNAVVNYIYNRYIALQGSQKYASEQEIIHCSALSNNSCFNGMPHQVMNYVKSKGVFSYSNYLSLPTIIKGKGGALRCKVKEGVKKDIYMNNAQVEVSYSNSVTSLKAIVDSYGVAAVGISSYTYNFMFYSSGVLRDCGDAPEIDHIVTLVGYNVQRFSKGGRAEHNWLLRNSYGSFWGTDGDFYVAM